MKPAKRRANRLWTSKLTREELEREARRLRRETVRLALALETLAATSKAQKEALADLRDRLQKTYMKGERA